MRLTVLSVLTKADVVHFGDSTFTGWQTVGLGFLTVLLATAYWWRGYLERTLTEVPAYHRLGCFLYGLALVTAVIGVVAIVVGLAVEIF